MQEYIAARLRKTLEHEEQTAEDDDDCIIAEEAEMRTLFEEYTKDPSCAHKSEYAIQMHGLRKEYKSNRNFPMLASKRTEAINRNWFGVKKGEWHFEISRCPVLLMTVRIYCRRMLFPPWTQQCGENDNNKVFIRAHKAIRRCVKQHINPIHLIACKCR
jgi:hypothetical protein